MHSNWVVLSEALKKTKEFNKMKQRSIDWCIYNSQGILCDLWKNKRPILLISTSATPIGFPCFPIDIVPIEMEC